jgi:transcriptional regulator with XRE-family HTH domain
MSTLGERIRKVRKINELNQVEFSKMIGVSQGTLSELEKDKYMPPVDSVMAIREKFEVSIDWLLFGLENTEAQNHIYKDNQTSNLLVLFQELTDTDQEEIIEIIRIKLRRNNR